MHYNQHPRFPQNFMWGASSAAWQVEGAVAEDGRTPAIIDLNSKTKAPFADNSIAADHYHHVKEDVALMAKCGFSSYRFSLSWPRIIPASNGEVNQAGISFYNNLIDELKAHNIEPIVTLYHYDMPLWVEEELGGWKSRATIAAFEHYARTCFEAFGDRVKYWLSINEQNMQIAYGDWLGVSKGCNDWFRDQWRVNHIINLCHATAVNLCHELVEGGKIGPVPGMVPIYPASSHPMDQIAAMNAEEFTEKIWNDTYVFGRYSNFLQAYWRNNNIDPGIEPGDEELMASAHIDFIAVNCYRSNTAKWAPASAKPQAYQLNKTGEKGKLVFPVVPGAYQLVRNPHVEYTDWDWEIDPVSLRYVLRYLWDHYQLPLMVTENGFGAHEHKDENGEIHDQARINYLRENIFQLGLAIEDGCEVISYNPWSFTDLLSTGNGIEKRYGLVYIDVTDDELNQAQLSGVVPPCTRIEKDSFTWYSKLITSNGTEWGGDISHGC
ncbi:glycoside hydrolase family 1 protein [Collinsella sp. zg1085]|uniref:glycoside hydrolase family 1 protein n=1 Tax=Collinsella sp. zg1085 TaxID=2844380 RepID=UPI001C0E3EB5|nr:glycoside hydrolase family 1 protein [Collinsella sp. zg1085]QWT17650.1 glycoside hydrolase family 1 protein [Collinsella sp. zg1085]